MTDLPRRIAVTGSAGLLGEASVDRLTSLPSTEVVAAIDTRMTRGPSGETRRFISVVRDIRSPLDELFRALEIDCVIHLAFAVKPERDDGKARSINIAATKSLLDTCAKTGVRQFVYVSSTTVYGAYRGSGLHTEDEEPRPLRGFQYSEHKVEAEQLVQAFSEDHPEVAVSILRGCVVMAPGADNFITRSLGMPILPSPAGANPSMQFLHVDDYTDALEAVVVRNARGIYNLAGEGVVSWREVAAMTGARMLPVPAPILKGFVAASWAARLQNTSSAAGLELITHPWLASTDKARVELGWSPAHTSAEALQAWANARS